MKFFKFMGNFLAVIVMIIMFFFLIGAFTFGIAVKLVSPNGITDLVQEVDFSSALVDKNGNKLEFYQDLIKDSGFSEEEINNVLNSSSFKEFVGEILGSAVYYSITLDDDAKLTSIELDSKLKDSINKISSESGINLTETEKRQLFEMISNNGDEVLDLVYSNKIVSDGNMFKFLIDNYLWIIVFVCVIFFLIIALFRGSFIKALGDFGVVTLTSGIFFLLLGLLSSMKFVSDFLVNFFNDFGNLVISLIKPLGNMVFINGIIMVLVGILFIVISGLIKKKLKRKIVVVSNDDTKGNSDDKGNEDGSISDVKVMEDKNSDDTMEMKTFAERVEK